MNENSIRIQTKSNVKRPLDIRAILGSATADKKGVVISRISQWIEILAHITCYSLGSNYPLNGGVMLS